MTPPTFTHYLADGHVCKTWPPPSVRADKLPHTESAPDVVADVNDRVLSGSHAKASHINHLLSRVRAPRSVSQGVEIGNRSVLGRY
jgi:hypothetical protein